jgi:hypothetical protein
MGPSRAIGWILASAMAGAGVASGNTQVVQVQPTNTQAVVYVNTDQAGNCRYRISEWSSLAPTVNDVNEALFPGSSLDSRTSSVVRPNSNGSTDHWFVAGTRKGDQGSDGRWYSRALAASTAHFGGVTCGTDAEVPFQFTTSAIPQGITFTEPLPFDSRALGNYAIPTFDFTDLTKMYVDPQTGYKFRLMTGPGQMPETSQTLYGVAGKGASVSDVAPEASGANWTNPSQGLAVDGNSASYTAAAQDVLTLRLAGGCPFAECAGYGWQNVINGGGFHSTNIDAYQVALTGNGAGSSVQVDLALSWNGVTQGSEWETVTLPGSNGAVTYPSSFSALQGAWQSPNYPIIPAMYWQVVEQRYTVNTSGTVVQLPTAPGPYNGAGFSLDARVLTAGSKITINGAEYTIASVDSATQVTLTSSAGNQTGVVAFIANFSVMIRKHFAGTGTVNIDGVTVGLAFSNSFGNGGAGFQQFCSAVKSTDAQGHTGRFCIYEASEQTSGIFWVTDDLQVRFLGRASLPKSQLGVAGDEWASATYSGQSTFDTSDPNSWWIATSLASTGRTTLVKATYHPEGVAACAQTANYQTLPPGANYDPGSSDNCNIAYSELTRPSQGLDMWSQLPAVITSGKFGNLALSFVENGTAILSTNGGTQDSEAWLVTVNLSTGKLVGTFSTYMNQAEGSCRGCVLHGVGPSSPADNWYYLIFNNYFGGNTANGVGPYNLTVTTALTTTPSNATCAGVTDPAVAWLIPYSNGCDDITLAGADNIPCDPNPSAWESANVPACTWLAGATQWQTGAIQVGDQILDPALGYEIMAFARNVNGTTWTVVRNINPPQGPMMTPVAGVNPAYLRNHPVGWTATILCSYHQNAFVQTSEVDGSGMLWDRKFYGFNHAVLRPAGIISAEFFNDINDFGQSVRIGRYAPAANQPETARIRNTAPFAGKVGLGGTNYVQSHIGWDGNPSSYTDMAPIAPGSGGQFTLWPQPGVTNISGSLYKIPAANAFIAEDKRRRATAVWAGMNNFQDVSGTGTITGGAADGFKYCSIDYAGATCGQSGEWPGDVFLNIPQATIDGNTGGAYDLNRANAVPLGQEPLAVMQYYFQGVAANSTQNLGRYERRITTGFGRYNGQDSYSNAKVIFNSNLLVFNCGTPNLQRIEDLCIGQVPPDSTAQMGSDFHQILIPVNVAGQYAEVQFGYAENGAANQFFCTTRLEACNTSSPNGTPFNWEGEQRALKQCRSGCTIGIPAIPGRVVYYRVRWSDDGMTWTNSGIGVAVGQPLLP